MMTVFESQSHIHHGQHATIDIVPQLLLAAPFIVVSLLYLVGYFLFQSRSKRWPLPRIIFWMLGNGCAIASVLGPIADRAHADFTVHMLAHLLLGMLGPLLMVLGAPMSLLLRTLPVTQAKKITRLLRTRYFQFMTGPVVTTILNIGGLWLLYTTDLYSMMHQSMFLHVFIHLHVFLASYLFTSAFISVDPHSQQTSFLYRAVVFTAALAGHEILSKYIYAFPPVGVSANDAELGGMLMYYGGDAVDVVIIAILCYRWYKKTRPRLVVSPGH